MSHVNVTIHGRQYRMACENGQEDHLLRLARDLENRIEQLKKNFGAVGDMRLMVMAALTIADELTDTDKRLRRLEEDIAVLKEGRAASTARAQATEAAIIAAFNAAAERIEGVTRTLNLSTVGDNGVAMG